MAILKFFELSHSLSETYALQIQNSFLIEIIIIIKMRQMIFLTDSEGSIGSSTHSGESLRSSAKNTLLATGTNLHLKKAMSKFENDMNIDSGLLNPDSLWKRDAQK